MKLNDSIRALTANKLKVIAIVTMFIDHFVSVFFTHNTVFNMMLKIPGRVAAPIMCYMIAEGYYKTSDRKRYLRRLLIFSVISHFAYNLCFGYEFFEATSVIWSLTMGLVALMIVKSGNLYAWVKVIAVGACCLLAITANWNYVGVCWVVTFGVFYGDVKKQMLGFVVVGVLLHLVPTFLNFTFSHAGLPHWYQLGIFLAIPLLLCYNGQLGKKSKIISRTFYWFYPVHLVFIWLLAICIPLMGGLA